MDDVVHAAVERNDVKMAIADLVGPSVSLEAEGVARGEDGIETGLPFQEEGRGFHLLPVGKVLVEGVDREALLFREVHVGVVTAHDFASLGRAAADEADVPIPLFVKVKEGLVGAFVIVARDDGHFLPHQAVDGDDRKVVGGRVELLVGDEEGPVDEVTLPQPLEAFLLVARDDDDLVETAGGFPRLLEDGAFEPFGKAGEERMGDHGDANRHREGFGHPKRPSRGRGDVAELLHRLFDAGPALLRNVTFVKVTGNGAFADTGGLRDSDNRDHGSYQDCFCLFLLMTM